MRAKNIKPVQAELSAEQAATLLSHVRELQLRLLVTAAVLVGAGVVAYLYYPQIIEILRKPLNAPLIISSVSGSFSFVMKICLVAGIAVSVPLIVYNFIMFVRPAFIEVFTRKRVFMMTAGSVIAAAGGTLFGYFFIIPGAIHFFSGFHVSGVNTMIQADGYLNFVVNVLVTFTLMFQLPILVSLIDRIKPIPPRAMWKGEKWALIGSIIISLIVPFAMDIMTQVLIAAPIFLLYNISFVVVVLQHRYARGVERRAVRSAAKTERAVRPAKPVRGVPVAAATVSPLLTPHPQLAEVMALQAGSDRPVVKPVSLPAHQATKKILANKLASTSVHAPAQPTKTLRRAVVAQPKLVTATLKPIAAQPVKVVAPAVSRPPVSMDVYSAPAANRMRPANVIRSAGAIKAPSRAPVMPLRPLNLMSDIR